MSTRSRRLDVDDAVRAMLLLMPRLVGRAKRLPMPDTLKDLDLAPRHLALLAHLQYDGALHIDELARRLDVAPTTVSLMVSDLARAGVVEKSADPADQRRRRVEIAESHADDIRRWLSGTATAWRTAFADRTAEERAAIVATLLRFEEALEEPVPES